MLLACRLGDLSALEAGHYAEDNAQAQSGAFAPPERVQLDAAPPRDYGRLRALGVVENLPAPRKF